MKKNVLWLLIAVILLTAFNAAFFLVTNERTSATWISYGDIHIAFLMLFLSLSLVGKEKNKAILNLSLNAVSVIYFIIELLIGVIVISLSPQTPTAAILVQSILFAIYLVIFLSVLLANQHTMEAEAQHASDIQFIKTSAARIKILVNQVDEFSQRRLIEQAYDAVRSSPSKSDYSVATIESDISVQINTLEAAIGCHDSKAVISAANAITSAIYKRNQILIAKQ